MLNKAAAEITRRISELLADKPAVIIAIDGRCASGKSTISQMLNSKLECNIIHMDDFFLRPEQRTAQRFSEIGGNVDYERFEQEVIVPLIETGEAVYCPFDCSTGNLGEAVRIARKAVTIVEGSYSCHPKLWDYYDLHCFITTSPETQLERLGKRSPALLERFTREWIPMEERYFGGFEIEKRCEIIIST